MSFLRQYNGFDLEDLEIDDDLIDSYSSNNDSILEDCYIEESNTKTTMKSQTTTTKLKKAARSSLSSYDASSRRASGDSTISSTTLPLALTPPPLPSSSSLAPSLVGEGRKKKSKTKKSVQFAGAEEWFFVLPLKQYTEKELKKCWYTRSDIIRRDASLDLIALRIEEKKSPKEHETFRGLEELDAKHRERSEGRRVAVVRAVLEAQKEYADVKVEHGVVDPLFLAVASIELTVDSKTDALESGMKDMLEVMPFSSDSKKPRRSLPAVEKVGTMVDPFCVPDRPRRNSAPASSLHRNPSAKYDSKEFMEALALFDDMDVSAPPAPPAPPVPSTIVTPESGKSKKRTSSPSRRHSLDSSSKHNKSKSRSRSSTSSSSGKTKSSTVKSPASPSSRDTTRSPVKKKARASVSSHRAQQPSPKKKDSKSRSSSKSPSSSDRRSSRFKLPFAPSVFNSSRSSPPAPQEVITSPSASNKKQSTRKTIVPSTPMQSPRRSSRTNNKNSEPQSPGGSRGRIAGNSSSSMRINAPTPPRQDPPGMFHRIASIRLDDHYPPTVPRL